MVAERLQQLRLATGLSQEAVAQEMHMSRSTYSSYETGRRVPSLDVLPDLAKYYKTTTDFLLGVTDDPGLPPTLDEKGQALIRLYQTVDERGRDTIYRMALHEKMQYGGSGEEKP